jgi:hypothetical protein
MLRKGIVLAVSFMVVINGCKKEDNPATADTKKDVGFFDDTNEYPPSTTQNGVQYSLTTSVDTTHVGQGISVSYNITNNSSGDLALGFPMYSEIQLTVRKIDGTLLLKRPSADSNRVSPITVTLHPSEWWGPYVLIYNLVDDNNVPIPAGTYRLRARINASPAQPILMKNFVIQ